MEGMIWFVGDSISPVPPAPECVHQDRQVDRAHALEDARTELVEELLLPTTQPDPLGAHVPASGSRVAEHGTD